MPVVKAKTDYITTPGPDFKPGPKNGHYSELDPEFAKNKAGLDANIAGLWAPEVSLQELRKAWTADQAPPPGCPVEGQDVLAELKKIKMRDGAEIEVKIYTAKDKKGNDAALLLRTHGGGWAFGGHNIENAENLMLAGKTNAVVVSVDYRMSPDYKFPYALNDSYDAMLWAKNNAASLGVDPEKIIVVGGSAGANLAAALALMAREEKVSGIVGQILCYPVTCHPKYFPTEKYELMSYEQHYHNSSIINPMQMEWLWDMYTEPSNDWRVSPLLADSLKHLPPALVLVAGFDVFRDEGIAYAEKLKEHGVDTEFEVYQGLPHVFYMFPEHEATLDYYERMVNFVKKHGGQ